MPCPTCHSNEWIPAPAPGEGSLFKRLTGWGAKPAAGAGGKRKCKFCGTVYDAPPEPEDDDPEEARIAQRLERMEKRMSGFQDSRDHSSIRPSESPSETGEEVPLYKRAASLEMRPEKGMKCLKCGHFAYLVPSPDLACPACGRVYAKMEEEAERERQRKLAEK